MNRVFSVVTVIDARAQVGVQLTIRTLARGDH